MGNYAALLTSLIPTLLQSDNKPLIFLSGQ